MLIVHISKKLYQHAKKETGFALEEKVNNRRARGVSKEHENGKSGNKSQKIYMLALQDKINMQTLCKNKGRRTQPNKSNGDMDSYVGYEGGRRRCIFVLFFFFSLSLFSFASRTCVNDRAFVMSCRGMVVVVEA